MQMNNITDQLVNINGGHSSSSIHHLIITCTRKRRPLRGRQKDRHENVNRGTKLSSGTCHVICLLKCGDFCASGLRGRQATSMNVEQSLNLNPTHSHHSQIHVLLRLKIYILLAPLRHFWTFGPLSSRSVPTASLAAFFFSSSTSILCSASFSSITLRSGANLYPSTDP